MSGAALLIVGAGGHAQACIDVVERSGAYGDIGLIGMPGDVGHAVLGHRVVGCDDDLGALRGRFSDALVGVGQIRSPAARIRLYSLLEDLGYRLPAIVSPAAVISRHAVIGPGSIVMHGAIIGPGATIGRNCIVNSGALIEHGAVVDDHCHIATRAVLNGDVRIGRGSFVGSSSVVREGIVIGRDCLVGMGSSVRKNLEDGSQFVGS